MKNLILFFAIVAALSSCKKEETDTTAPKINSVRVNGVSAEEHDLNAGSTIEVTIDVSDNENLNQLKVDIHSADDGHTHDDSTTGELEAPNVGVWSELRVENLSGKSTSKTFNFIIPATIAGHWHIEVKLIDKEGNEAIEYVTTLHVENSNLPVFNISSSPAALNYEIEIPVNGTISLSGTVSDPDGLVEIHWELENEASDDIFLEGEIPTVNGTSFDLGTINLGPIPAGEYHLHVHAKDTQGYEGEWSVHVHAE